ncbi:MAG: hypothetical protein COX65_09375 [Elusimicrobia bacterium CG_4_10_14_0_2_um_filter_56_8]|nr:MAG: hypothetical protein AUJ51_01300 [Elusimicrobia bacterium CG1_02_56_21]PJA11935.1 MAG: hypothetical protein COX65_09375 [Elusimicrobia bacterium CG_4_10_14_0_2_um_filter_56_8]
MKKTLIALALIFAAGAVHAEGNKNWMSWYGNMLKGLKSGVSKKFESKHRVSAVAAVRGKNMNEDPYALYWKGGISEKARKKMETEKQELTGAVELVVAGDTEAGRAAISKFLKANPDSFFAQDAKDALANLPGPEAKPEGVKKEAAAEVPAAEEVSPEKPGAKTGN